MSNQETDLKGCEGCKSNERECALKPYFIDEQGNKIVCPCSICLIKMICKELCSDIQVYYIQVYFRSYHSRGDIIEK